MRRRNGDIGFSVLALSVNDALRCLLFAGSICSRDASIMWQTYNAARLNESNASSRAFGSETLVTYICLIKFQGNLEFQLWLLDAVLE